MTILDRAFGNGIVTNRLYGRQDNLVTSIATPNIIRRLFDVRWHGL